ncbi:hypothetical protein Golomagni_02981 [Golovinomyces magnicellulatus]|nr:hypothetical protein Golomagni_02981 [Golovinomyces magnicellulatus]
MPLDELSNASKETKRAVRILWAESFFPRSNNNASAPTELSAVVEDLLNTLSNKFAGVSSEIFAKSRINFKMKLVQSIVDEMSRRLDNLEDSLKNNQLPESESPKK